MSIVDTSRTPVRRHAAGRRASGAVLALKRTTAARCATVAPITRKMAKRCARPVTRKSSLGASLEPIVGGAITNVRGKEFVKYVAGIALPSVVTVLLISVVAHPEIHVHADFYAAIAQIIPVLLLADFLLFARTRRLLATAVKRRSEIARLREENRKLSAKAADRQSEYEMLVAKFEELRLEAVRLGSPIPARPEPMDDVADDGHESDDSAGFDLDKLAGAIDGAITATLAWAVAAEGGALVALASDTSSILTLQLAVLGTAWLTIVLAITEIMSESVSTSEDATGEVF